MIPMNWFLIFAAALFSIGLYGVLARKNAIMILMGIELMLNAVNINLVTFWRYTDPSVVAGQVFAVVGRNPGYASRSSLCYLTRDA